MKKFEIHSERGNYYLPAEVCNVDTSDIGPNSTNEEFSGVELNDVVVSEVQRKGWLAPVNYQLKSTNSYHFTQAGIELTNDGSFYFYDLGEGSYLQMYHSVATPCFTSDVTSGYLGGKDLKGHKLTSWAQYAEWIVYFCDKVFNNEIDRLTLLNAFVDNTKVHCTKDSCVGYSLRNLGSVSLRYKLLWIEIDEERLRRLKF